ncbi:hypothetical protein DMN91_002172 [Ooceraea biroi]|uniref:Uncharacterized protein n=1 Tax=Ooceraea biroi TaxID=2015173 RepID=A0A3L8E1E2_OOCBI|nr:hypothetical protein DMN91_002172 [Ooceraea biroi]
MNRQFLYRNQSTAIFIPDFLDVVTSSMSNKLEYLEKYSVAPPPSRDYYGLKVLQNEIILHLWRISHGPHKAPIVHCAKFVEFDQETSLQDEKRRGFATTKSEIFNTDKELSDNPFVVRDSDLDLADLIEASLKNIRSPRSIFDYDFSCMQQSDARRNDLKSRNGIQDIDRVKLLKPMRSSVITNYLSDKMTRTNEILEKLSEKSEPFSGTSCESLVNDKKVLSGGDNGWILIIVRKI